ncbi:hypothetical protein DDD_1340 [Nonlabens dokdonensis DSW-6]|uniref:Uncharacterized protein n=1 Tax=Nonlabens dokdonensis (strain DSM 17205 / KCTC 12402 / DSW-6) TaxID=592029 RepID=L7W8C7_NONDD|nr:hypothetical protein DDD_1340 [Nonlabens dokdonensis DSW-6]
MIYPLDTKALKCYMRNRNKYKTQLFLAGLFNKGCSYFLIY